MSGSAAAALAIDSTAALRADGSGSLAVERIESRSLVTRARAASPLRLLTPRNHGNAAWVYTSTYGGGFVDGDDVRLDVSIGAGATALLTSQAATKVYRSPHGTASALDARIADGGLLLVAPDPVVCFAGASYRQTQRFELEATAGLVLVDWFTSGRHGSGERWRLDRYATRVTVSRRGRLMLMDALSLDAADGPIEKRMGRFDVALMALVVGAPLEQHAGRVLSEVAGKSVGRRADLLVSASAVAGGCLVRMIGTSVEQVGRAARALLDFVPAMLGDDPWSRKW
jgi:urease accessory protein